MRDLKSWLVAGAVVGAAVGGAALASAATSKTSTSTPPTSASRLTYRGPAHGSAAHEDAEKPVTGNAATEAEAAAVKAAGGGTATEVTTDFNGNGYEVTVKKSDGSSVEIHLDKAFNLINGPGGHQHGGAPPSGLAAGTEPSE